MLPKEKAKELVCKFYKAIIGKTDLELLQAKACTFVFVNEVIGSNPEYWSQVGMFINDVQLCEV